MIVCLGNGDGDFFRMAAQTAELVEKLILDLKFQVTVDLCDEHKGSTVLFRKFRIFIFSFLTFIIYERVIYYAYEKTLKTLLFFIHNVNQMYEMTIPWKSDSG